MTKPIDQEIDEEQAEIFAIFQIALQKAYQLAENTLNSSGYDISFRIKIEITELYDDAMPSRVFAITDALEHPEIDEM